MDRALLQETGRKLAASWNLDPAVAEAKECDYDLLLRELQSRIQHMLRGDVRKLMTALYILDISERRYLQAMDQPTIEDRAFDLAAAIMERETQKIATRRKYAQQSSATPTAQKRLRCDDD